MDITQLKSAFIHDPAHSRPHLLHTLVDLVD